MTEEPVTFREPAYVLFSTKHNAALTNDIGQIAVFNTRIMANLSMAKVPEHMGPVIVRPVRIIPLDSPEAAHAPGTA